MCTAKKRHQRGPSFWGCIRYQGTRESGIRSRLTFTKTLTIWNNRLFKEPPANTVVTGRKRLRRISMPNAV